MWKDFFYYSKSERRAVYILSFLIIGFIVTLTVLSPESSFPEEESVVVEENARKDSLLYHVQDSLGSVKQVTSVRPERIPVLASFDPNTADSIELLKLGLPTFVIRNVIHYREKGGRFRTPDSFKRIYGLTEKQFETLRPYIQIAEIPQQKQDTFHYEKKDTVFRIYKYPEGTLVDVGIADTTELKKIPGIGSGISKAIVGYRNRLGGFYSLEQLMEVKFVTPDLMKWFKLDSVSIRQIPVNRSGLDKLRSHPYINFYQARVIIEHRRLEGEIKSLSQLSLYEEFTEKDLQRLSVYLTFD